jgi:hypothetical protein
MGKKKQSKDSPQQRTVKVKVMTTPPTRQRTVKVRCWIVTERIVIPLYNKA